MDLCPNHRKAISHRATCHQLAHDVPDAADYNRRSRVIHVLNFQDIDFLALYCSADIRQRIIAAHDRYGNRNLRIFDQLRDFVRLFQVTVYPQIRPRELQRLSLYVFDAFERLLLEICLLYTSPSPRD